MYSFIRTSKGAVALQFIKKGFHMVTLSERLRTELTEHKTVATRAGLGWIGKCALLVTEEYGSAVRITSVLTDAPLEVNKPVNNSNCGTCNNCVRNCPAEASSGDLWAAGMKRETFFDYLACRNKTIERT
jgi:epoxyqueuosine reductase QueG